MKTWQLLKENPQLWDRYFVKEKVIRAVRKFFESRNYHELESPILAPALPTEHYLNPVIAKLGTVSKAESDLYLIPSTERYNKIALAAGIGEHFVITKVFRGVEEVSPNHSPEFTMLEWYHLNADYNDLMNDTEELINFIINQLKKSESKQITYQEQDIDFSAPWPRFSVVEMLFKYCELNLEDIQDIADFRQAMLKKGYNVTEADDWEMLFELLFANEIEVNLPTSKPCFVFDYPKQLCPLTKLNNKNALVAQKVELYIAGKELANGYTELTNGEEQKQRFEAEAELRKAINKKPIKFDYELVAALNSGLPVVAGIGLGLDRLIMILADVKNISEINLFPGSELLNGDFLKDEKPQR